MLQREKENKRFVFSRRRKIVSKMNNQFLVYVKFEGVILQTTVGVVFEAC